LFAELVEIIKNNTAEDPQPSEWRSDPFAFRAVNLAFTQILNALEPKGEMRPPTEIWLSHAIINAESPEGMADIAASFILYWLEKPPMSDSDVRFDKYGRPLATRSYTRLERNLHYGMTDAGRDLTLKRRER
jgi:hypothetical protein